jgi:hypothetical protein
MQKEQIEKIRRLLLEAKQHTSSLSPKDMLLYLMNSPDKNEITIRLVASLSSRRPELASWEDAKTIIAAPDFIGNLASVGLDFLLDCSYSQVIRNYLSFTRAPSNSLYKLTRTKSIVKCFSKTVRQLRKLPADQLAAFRRQVSVITSAEVISRLMGSSSS